MTDQSVKLRDRHRLFHLAFCVDDLESTREFYGDFLGCPVGRTSDRWIDFDFFGNQITAHLVDTPVKRRHANPVDGDKVPVPHFGAILTWPEWEDLVEKIKTRRLDAVIGPRVRFQGMPGEQGTVFVRDPSGNMLEFKCFRDEADIFRRES